MSITLIEENGRRRERGGDKLHARIFNTTYGAYAPGYVIDHNNGIFTAEVPALWPGVSIISILLKFPREDIRVMYATMQQVRREHASCAGQSTTMPPRLKTNNVVSEQVGHKLGCTSTEDG